MNPEVKQKWVDALRSGDYKQGQMRLNNKVTNRFCCLGVLCDLHSKETGNEWNECGHYLGRFECLPEEVQKWADIPSENPTVPYEGESMGLIGLNDKGTVGFNYIADLIEKNL